MSRRPGLLGALLLTLAVGGPASAQPEAARGAVLAGLAGCVACHTGKDGPPLGGGHEVETKFGVFRGPNVSTDPVHGIGAWTEADFVRAMRLGKAPDGHPYYPAFPYTSFTWLTDEDLADLWAWLRAQPAVDTPDLPHDVLPRYRGRALLGLWRSLAFRRGPWRDDPRHDAVWNLGAYLVRGPGHCGECHTPRDGVGKPRARAELAGSHDPPEPAPNLTPHPDALEGWSEEDWVTFLELGMLPDGDFVGGEMMRVVEEGTSQLTDAERAAMAAYLRDLRPVADR